MEYALIKAGIATHLIAAADDAEAEKYRVAYLRDSFTALTPQNRATLMAQYLATVPAPSIDQTQQRIIPKADFFDLMGETRLRAILTAAKTTIAVEAFVKRLDALIDVDLNDPRLATRLLQLESAGVIAPGSKVAILGY